MKQPYILVVAVFIMLVVGFVGGVFGYVLGQAHRPYETTQIGDGVACVVDERSGDVYLVGRGRLFRLGNLQDAGPLPVKTSQP